MLRFLRCGLFILIAGILVWGEWVSAETAPSATLTVCPSGCAHSTIQAAITAANAGDTIQILMTIAHTEVDIIITKDITIEGVDRQETIVQAATFAESGVGRVFIVLAGNTVTMRDFTIRYGDVSATDGGGIWIQDAATVTLGNMTLHDNRSADGGAIANSGTLMMNDFIIKDNKASSSRGGGIFNEGTAQLTDGLIDDNFSAGNGGGIYSANSEVEAQLTIHNVNLNDNTASNGGGIYNLGAMSIAGGGDLFRNEATYERGGGIYNNSASLVTIDDARIYFNNLTVSPSASFPSGAGIYTTSPMAITNSHITSNKATDPADLIRGGGIYVGSSEVTIVRSRIAFNDSHFGGGIYSAVSTMTLNQVAIYSNDATDTGGGIFQDSGTTYLTNVTVANNNAEYGGGIYQCNGSLNFASTTVANNVADVDENGNGEGGGLLMGCTNPLATLRSSIIAGNSVLGGGDYPDCSGQFSSGSFSLIGNTGPASGVKCSVGGTFTAGMIYNTSPQFGAATGNDYSHTVPLLAGSPAIDEAACASATGPVPTTDQRGAPMPIDGDGNGSAVCDMGAYEYNSVPTAVGISRQLAVSGEQWTVWLFVGMLVLTVGKVGWRKRA